MKLRKPDPKELFQISYRLTLLLLSLILASFLIFELLAELEPHSPEQINAVLKCKNAKCKRAYMVSYDYDFGSRTKILSSRMIKGYENLLTVSFSNDKTGLFDIKHDPFCGKVLQDNPKAKVKLKNYPGLDSKKKSKSKTTSINTNNAKEGKCEYTVTQIRIDSCFTDWYLGYLFAKLGGYFGY